MKQQIEHTFKEPDSSALRDSIGRRITNKRKPIKFIITADGCWECTSHPITSSGYPSCGRNNETFSVARYLLTINDPRDNYDGQEVLHSCDNTLCINPSHIKWGTRIENEREKMERGRVLRGENITNSVLKEADVIEMRALYTTGEYSHREISELFDVTTMTAHRAITGATWAHVKEGLCLAVMN